MELVNMELTEKELMELDKNSMDIKVFERIYDWSGNCFKGEVDSFEVYSNTVKKEELEPTVEIFLNEYFDKYFRYDNIHDKKEIAMVELEIFVNDVLWAISQAETVPVFIKHEINELKDLIDYVDMIKDMDSISVGDKEVDKAIEILENIMDLKDVSDFGCFEEYINDKVITDFYILDYEGEEEVYIELFFKKVNAIIDGIEKNWF